MNNAILTCQKLCKSYHDGNTSIHVLKQIELMVHPGDRIAIIGPSGSGKSTLLHLLGGLDNPTEGSVCVLNQDWQTLSEKKRCELRNTQFGFIYQFHHLLPELTALENVALPRLIAGQSTQAATTAAEEMLFEVGLSDRLTHKPAQLSGGERQRVAIARALVHQPACVLADEPTGNLDHATAIKIFELMLRLNQNRHTALIIVTHDIALAEKMDRIFSLQDGKLLPS